MRKALVIGAAVAAAWGWDGREAAAQTTFTDTFEGQVNSAGWSWNVTTPDTYPPTGGNPGMWLQNTLVSSFAPRLTTQAGTDCAFHGDYVAMGVTRISIDARTDFASLNSQRDFSLVLRDTHGTPNDFDDDDYVYFVGPLIPQPGQGWRHYDFNIPSDYTGPGLPAGWTGGYSGDLENLRPGVTFADVLRGVDSVEFWWIHPAFFAFFQEWSVGADNIAITAAGGGCPVDWNGDDVVNSSDISAFLTTWLASLSGGTLEADFNGDMTVNSTDISAFLTAWLAAVQGGC